MSDALGKIMHWDGERVPVQNESLDGVPKPIAEEAHAEYQEHFDQAFDRLHERGGFGTGEMLMFLWVRIQRLKDDSEPV